MHFKRVLGTAGIGLFAIVWALVQAAQGEWAFYALAGVLALATDLTIVEIFERRPGATPVAAGQTEPMDFSKEG